MTAIEEDELLARQLHHLNARDCFQVGDRVRRSAYGAQRNVPKAGLFATVVGFSHRLPYCIRVRRDRVAGEQTYAMAFWERSEILLVESDLQAPATAATVATVATVEAQARSTHVGVIVPRVTERPGWFLWRGRWRPA